MSATPNKNGQQKAQEAVQSLKKHLSEFGDNKSAVPLHRGALNIKAICKTLGVARSTANQNPAFRTTLENWCDENNIPFPGAENSAAHCEIQQKTTPNSKDLQSLKKELQQETKRANTLEKRVAELLAQNTHLQKRLRQQEARESFLTAQGKGGKRF